jgi:hypothetical protein
LAQPLEFPPLAQAAVLGDRVVLALDSGVPQAPAIIAEVFRSLSARRRRQRHDDPANAGRRVPAPEPASIPAADRARITVESTTRERESG